MLGVFPDLDGARFAVSRLVEAGWPRNSLTVKRVIDASFRGVTEKRAAQSMLHYPEVSRPTTLADDVGIHLVVLRVPSENLEVAREALAKVGASEVVVVEGTPPRAAG